MIRHQGKDRNHEDVSIQAWNTQVQPTDYRMDEWHIHCGRKILRYREEKLQHLIHLIMPTIQGIHRYQ